MILLWIISHLIRYFVLMFQYFFSQWDFVSKCTSPVKRAHTQNALLQRVGLVNVQYTKASVFHFHTLLYMFVMSGQVDVACTEWSCCGGQRWGLWSWYSYSVIFNVKACAVLFASVSQKAHEISLRSADFIVTLVYHVWNWGIL